MIQPVLVLILITAFAAVPQAQSSPPQIGAVVQTWHYDAAKSAVILRIVNISGKDITGWTTKIKETYDNGQTNEHEYSTDNLQLMFTVQQYAGTADGENLRQFGNGTFQAGTSRDEAIPVAHPVKDCEAAITVVLYADKTGETTDQGAFDRMVSARKVAASTMQKLSAIVRDAVLHSDTPHKTAAEQIRQMETQWKSQRHTSYDLDTGVLEGALRNLEDAPRISANQNVTITTYLNNYLAENDRRASALADHSKLGSVQ